VELLKGEGAAGRTTAAVLPEGHDINSWYLADGVAIAARLEPTPSAPTALRTPVAPAHILDRELGRAITRAWPGFDA
jgi:hypothetical protein